MDGSIKDWQSKTSLQDSLLHMFEAGLFGDVAFLVGDEGTRILAHKCVLASRSCVFERMFCGSLAESGDVSVPDITVPVFRDLMRFLYTNEVSLGASNVFPLLYAANKYSVERLEQRCVEFSKACLTPENAFTLLQQGDIFDKQDIVEKAKRTILSYPAECIQTEGFHNINFTWLQKFLRSENLNVKEIKLFEAVVEWAKAECKRQEKETSVTNLRSLLEDVLPLIRFPLMSHQDYLIVADSGILHDQELVNLYQHSTDKTRSPGPFVTRQRKDTKRITLKTNIHTGEGLITNKRFKEMLTITKTCGQSVELKSLILIIGDNYDIDEKITEFDVNVTTNGIKTAATRFILRDEIPNIKLEFPPGTLINREPTYIVISYEITVGRSHGDWFDSHPCYRHVYSPTSLKDDQLPGLRVVHSEPDSGQLIRFGLVSALEYVTTF